MAKIKQGLVTLTISNVEDIVQTPKDVLTCTVDLQVPITEIQELYDELNTFLKQNNFNEPLKR